MTTEREYQEAQRRIRQQRQRKNNQFLWIFLVFSVLFLLIITQKNQQRSPIKNPSNQEKLTFNDYLE